MPTFLENRLKREAASKGLTGRHADRYVYGTMNNRGYMAGNKETAKGRAMARKHARKIAGTLPKKSLRQLGSRAK